MATRYITEILDEINNDPKMIEKYKGNAALRLIFEHAFLEEKKFALPDGEPPYKKDAAPMGMSPGNLYQEVRRLYVFCRTDLNPIRKETLFVQLLENIHPREAELVVAVKDQKLTKMFPKVTHKLVADAGFIPAPVVKEKVAKNSKAPVKIGAVSTENA
jgi:hypothetical protein